MTRQTLKSLTENCPKCKYNDKTRPLREDSKYSTNIKNWYREHTTYTEEQIKNANFECERCNILFIRIKETTKEIESKLDCCNLNEVA